MIGALILGLIAGLLGRLFAGGKSPSGFIATILLGLGGAVVGWALFTKVLNIGDDDKFDLGGLPGAVIGVVILLWIYNRAVASRA